MWWTRINNRETQKANKTLSHLRLILDLFPNEAIAFLEQHTEAARIRDKSGNLSIHYYCDKYGRLNLSVVQALVKAYPESLSKTNEHGHLPLHLVLCRLFWNDDILNLDVIRFLIDKYPDALLVKNTDTGETPVEMLMSMRNAVDRQGNFRRSILPLVALMFDVCPASAQVVTSNQETLLHVACRNALKFTPSSHVYYISLVRLLVRAFPEAIHVRNQNGMPPLHVLSRMWSPYWHDDDLEFLFCQVVGIVSDSPECRAAKDEYGRTPLHYLCIQEAPNSVIMVLLSKDCSLAGIRDNRGRTPLHYVLERVQVCMKSSFRRRRSSHYDRFAPLMEALCLGAYVADCNGMTPLQFACENNFDARYIYLLVRMDPMESLSTIGFRVGM